MEGWSLCQVKRRQLAGKSSYIALPIIPIPFHITYTLTLHNVVRFNHKHLLLQTQEKDHLFRTRKVDDECYSAIYLSFYLKIKTVYHTKLHVDLKYVKSKKKEENCLPLIFPQNSRSLYFCFVGKLPDCILLFFFC